MTNRFMLMYQDSILEKLDKCKKNFASLLVLISIKKSTAHVHPFQPTFHIRLLAGLLRDGLQSLGGAGAGGGGGGADEHLVSEVRLRGWR